MTLPMTYPCDLTVAMNEFLGISFANPKKAPCFSSEIEKADVIRHLHQIHEFFEQDSDDEIFDFEKAWAENEKSFEYKVAKMIFLIYQKFLQIGVEKDHLKECQACQQVFFIFFAIVVMTMSSQNFKEIFIDFIENGEKIENILRNIHGHINVFEVRVPVSSENQKNIFLALVDYFEFSLQLLDGLVKYIEQNFPRNQPCSDKYFMRMIIEFAVDNGIIQIPQLTNEQKRIFYQTVTSYSVEKVLNLLAMIDATINQDSMDKDFFGVIDQFKMIQMFSFKGAGSNMMQ